MRLPRPPCPYRPVTQTPCTYAHAQAKPLADRFSDPALNEAMRIFPYTLRITGYSRAPAAWPARPKIHFEGESCLDVAPAAMAPVADAPVQRCLSGTVQMAASGDVHWTIVRPSLVLVLVPSPVFFFLVGGRLGCFCGRSAKLTSVLLLLWWICFLFFFFGGGVCSSASARIRRNDRLARACRLAAVARPWASSASGPTRRTG